MMFALKEMSKSADEAYNKYKAAVQGPLWDDTIESDIPVAITLAKRVLAYYTDALKWDNGERLAYKILGLGELYQTLPDQQDHDARICMYLRGLLHGYSANNVMTAEKGADIWQSDEIVPLHDIAINWTQDNGEEIIVIETKSKPSKESTEKFRDYCVGEQYWILDLAYDG